MDWSGCPIVVSRPGYISGAPALRDDPRVPASTIVDNMDASDAEDEQRAAAEVIDLFQLRTPLKDVLEVYHYAQTQRASSP
jgi:uncharacterized protein (DUF433 family)